MSDYREELLNSVDTQSSELTKGVSQIDVTSSGNYAATWMEQDGGKSAIDRAAEANLAMAEIWRATFPHGGEWTGLDATQTTETKEGDQHVSGTWASPVKLSLPSFEYTSTIASFYKDGEILQREVLQEDLDQAFNEYIYNAEDQDLARETVNKAKQTQVYQLLEKASDYEEARYEAVNQAYDMQQAEETSAPEPQGRPIGDLSALEESVAQANQEPSPRQTPNGKKDREFGPQQQTKTEEKVARRREALRERQARAQTPALDMEIGEANENRQPNFREASTSMNASVNDFATTVADQFEDQAQALSVATARIRALERMVREAMR